MPTVTPPASQPASPRAHSPNPSDAAGPSGTGQPRTSPTTPRSPARPPAALANRPPQQGAGASQPRPAIPSPSSTINFPRSNPDSGSTVAFASTPHSSLNIRDNEVYGHSSESVATPAQARAAEEFVATDIPHLPTSLDAPSGSGEGGHGGAPTSAGSQLGVGDPQPAIRPRSPEIKPATPRDTLTASFVPIDPSEPDPFVSANPSSELPVDSSLLAPELRHVYAPRLAMQRPLTEKLAQLEASATPEQIQVFNDWKRDTDSAREKAFGKTFATADSVDTLGKKLKATLSGYDSAAFALIGQGLQSGVTFGTRGGVATTLKEALNFSPAQAGAIAGIPMSLANFLIERVVASMQDAYTKMELPELERVPAKAVIPDPCPLKVVTDGDGNMHFEKKSKLETLSEQKDVDSKRLAINRWQTRAEGKGVGSFGVPLGVTSGNVTRKLLALEPTGTEVGWQNGIASFLGGGIAKAMLNFAKTSLHAKGVDTEGIDTGNAGQLNMPMFTKRVAPLPDSAQADEASASEAGASEAHAKNENPAWKFGRLMLTNLGEQLHAMSRNPKEAVYDVVVTNMLPSILASVIGEVAGDSVTIDKGLDPFEGITKAPEYYEQKGFAQAMTSFFASGSYRPMKDAINGPEKMDWKGAIQLAKDTKEAEKAENTRTEDVALASEAVMPPRLRHRGGTGGEDIV